MTAVFLNGPLRNEFPVKLSAAVLQQSLKGRADRAFVSDTDRPELAEGFVKILDGLVGWLEVEFIHHHGGTIAVGLRGTDTL